MTPTIPSTRPLPPLCHTMRRAPAAWRRRWYGMNFPEVLFAVMILGIGFIMVAAIFPVAIQQSKSSTEETMGVRLAQAARAAIEVHATNAYMPPTGPADTDIAPVVALSPSFNSPPDPANPAEPLWKRLQGDFISAIDPRFGFAALYRRGMGRDYAQLFIIPLQVQVRDAYQAADVWNGSVSAMAPLPLEIERLDRSGTPHGVVFTAVHPALVEGAVIIIADDPDGGRRNGQILRLGRRLSPTAYELAIGWDLEPGEEYADAANPIAAFVVGRGARDPTVAAPVLAGPSQAISVYTMTIPIRRN